MDSSPTHESTSITGEVELTEARKTTKPVIENPNLEGVTLGNVTIKRKLGSGGMGDVWLGYDESLDIEVAVKVMHQKIASNQRYVRRFMREARAVARLDHPNIVRVFQVKREEYQGVFLRLMVMEYVKGLDAYRTRRRQPGRKFTPKRAAQIVLEVARALEYSHGRGVIHRDIKPANIILAEDSGVVKVLDFGLAKKLSEEDTREIYKTKPGMLLGTPQYMGPEQIRRQGVDGRADIYSLGVSLYEFVAGRLPFRGTDHLEIVRAHRDQALPFDDEHFDEVPKLLIKAIKGMCTKDPDERWSLRRVQRELETFLGITPSRELESEVMVSIREMTNLETRATSFIGREDEVRALLDLVSDSNKRLVTVIGPGGVGKTALAQECGRRLLGLEDGGATSGIGASGNRKSSGSGRINPAGLLTTAGVWFVDLADAYTEEGVCLAIAQAIGHSLHQNNTQEELARAIELRGSILLILDNCEQVIDDLRAVIENLLSLAPKLLALATSREALHSPLESVMRLDVFDISRFEVASPAIQLFVDRAKAVRKDFEINDDNREAVEKILAALDGIPLAIELAAARISALTPQKILDRLPQRLDILRSRRRDASARHQTLRSTIKWSWNLLDPWEKLALVQCSIFRGGFFLDAAEAVVDLSPFEDAPFAIDVIESLHEKNMLMAGSRSDVAGEVRYRLYEGVRDYAGEALDKIVARLDESVLSNTGKITDHKRRAVFVENALMERHADFYLRYGTHWIARLSSDSGSEAEARLALEMDNFDAIQQRFAASAPEKTALMALVEEEVLAIRGPTGFRVPNLLRAKERLGLQVSSLKLRVQLALARVYRDLEDEISAAREAEESQILALALAELDPKFKEDALFAQARVEAKE